MAYQINNELPINIIYDIDQYINYWGNEKELTKTLSLISKSFNNVLDYGYPLTFEEELYWNNYSYEIEKEEQQYIPRCSGCGMESEKYVCYGCRHSDM